MKIITLASIVSITFLAVLLSTTESLTYSTTPPPDACYIPGGGGCGVSSCHNSQPNTGPGSVSIMYDGNGTEYTPGTQYTVSVSVNDSTKYRFGFEAAVVDANNNAVGTLAVINSTTTSIQTIGGITYIGHKNADDTNIWTFNWTAPATDAGPVKFCVAGLAANNDDQVVGDNVYAFKLPLNSSQGVGISSIKENSTLRILSQDNGHLILSINPANAVRSVNLYTVSGQLAYGSTLAPGEISLNIPCYHLERGIYLLQCGNDIIKFVKP